MIPLTSLLRQEAVSLSTAERLGRVSGVVIDGDRIVAVHVDRTTIGASSIRSFEGDVLTYDGLATTAPHRPATTSPIGLRTLDVHGDQLGTIEDLQIAADGRIEAIVLAGGELINGARLRAVGSYAAIISAELPPPTGPPVA